MFSNLTDFSIEFLSNDLVVSFLVLALLLALTVLLYHRTNPPLPRRWRVTLGCLRGVAVLALMIALLEPLVGLTRRIERPPRVALLLDHSGSMERVEGDRSRGQRRDSLLATPAMAALEAETSVSKFYFGGNLTIDEEAVQTDRTALGEALLNADNQQLSAPPDYWLVFSDGNNNSGQLPVDAARTLAKPVYSIGMFGESDEFDIGLVSIDFNPVMFVGQAAEVRVKLNWNNAQGKAIRLVLNDSARTLTETRLDLAEPSGLAELQLKFTPTSPGRKLLSVALPILEGEANDGNNRRTISVKVLKNRLAVLLVTENPDYEVGFLHRFLMQSERFEPELLVTGRRSGNLIGRFPGDQAELNRFDLIILYDPSPALLAPYAPQLNSYLADRGGGLWVMMGPAYAAAPSAAWLERLLPFSRSASAKEIYGEFHGSPAENQLFHPAVRLADTRTGIREVWAAQPPFKMLAPCDQIASGAVVLATAEGTRPRGERLPILGFLRVGPGKVMASSVAPFWTWNFANRASGETTPYQKLVVGAINWLTTFDDFDPIRIAPEKEVFSRGEPARFEGFAFDQGYRPIPGVSGVVTVISDETGETYEADLLERAPGQHAAEFDQLPPGSYGYAAHFEKEDRQLKNESGKIMVEPFSLEEFDRRGDAATLMALSRATGGDYFHYSQFTEALASLDIKPVFETITSEFSVRGKFWLLLCFVGALATEWLLRKLFHLV